MPLPVLCNSYSDGICLKGLYGGRPSVGTCNSVCTEKKTPSKSFFAKLFAPPEIKHSFINGIGFNPGACEWNGGTILATRVVDGSKSSIWIGRLGGDRHVLLPHNESESYEDPRMFVHHGRLYLSCAIYRKEKTIQCLCEIEDDLSLGKLRTFNNFEGHRVEKNWVFFSCGEDVKFIYHCGRGKHEVHSTSSSIVHYSPSPIKWAFGQIRGGSSVVHFDHKYWTFFHSSVRYNGEFRYSMGAYAFEDFAPFRIVAYTQLPIYSPIEKCENDNKRVVFPGGLIKEGNEWVCYSGHNDERILISRISNRKLKGLMTWT